MTRFTADERVYRALERRFRGAKRILCEGDSWLSYPRKYLFWGRASNLVHHLRKQAHDRNWTIYDISRPGDTLSDMLDGGQRWKLRWTLESYAFDVLLFSGGGNDLVSNLDGLLWPHRKGMPWRDCVRWDRVAARLLKIKGYYEDLAHVVPEVSKNPDIRIICHTYDYPDPSGKGFSLFSWQIVKPWITPALERAHITKKADQRDLIRVLLTLYARTVQAIDGLTVVNTQGTLTPEDWKDELHPTSEGFRKVTDRIAAALG
jgi:hypothetical protein